MCVVGGKALKPDKMQTEDDEPKADADHVFGADRVLRERKHPMEKFLEDAESSLNTPQVCPDMPPPPPPTPPPPQEKTRPTTPAPKRAKVADTDASTKKKLASLEKQMAALKKQLAKR